MRNALYFARWRILLVWFIAAIPIMLLPHKAFAATPDCNSWANSGLITIPAGQDYMLTATVQNESTDPAAYVSFQLSDNRLHFKSVEGAGIDLSVASDYEVENTGQQIYIVIKNDAKKIQTGDTFQVHIWVHDDLLSNDTIFQTYTSNEQTTNPSATALCRDSSTLATSPAAPAGCSPTPAANAPVRRQQPPIITTSIVLAQSAPYPDCAAIPPSSTPAPQSTPQDVTPRDEKLIAIGIVILLTFTIVRGFRYKGNV